MHEVLNYRADTAAGSTNITARSSADIMLSILLRERMIPHVFFIPAKSSRSVYGRSLSLLLVIIQ